MYISLKNWFNQCLNIDTFHEIQGPYEICSPSWVFWTTWYSEWSFSAILYSTLWHVCAFASIFLHVEKKSFSHDLCNMEKLPAVYDASWHLVVWVFAVILNSTLSHKCTFAAIFSREKRNHFYIICVMEKVPGRLWWRR